MSEHTRIYLLLLLLISGTACSVFGAIRGIINISPYPEVIYADGKTISNITIEARDSSGRYVPDGTEIVLNTTIGHFKQNIVAFNQGTARAVLVSSSLPGIAKITGSITGFNSLGEAEVEFTKDRTKLNESVDYIEVEGKEYLAYFSDFRCVSASGSNKTAIVRFRKTSIQADTLQLDATTSRLIARKAVIAFDNQQLDCEELYYELKTRKGVAVADYNGKPAVVDIRGTEVIGVAEGDKSNLFRMRDDLMNSESYVLARGMTIFPNRKVQFRRASVYMTGQKVMSFPLYAVDITGGNQLFSTNLIGMNNGKLSFEFPYYYMLSPNMTGVVKFKTQQRSDRGLGASSGIFFDVEQSYRIPGKSDGGFLFTNVTNDEWGGQWRHRQRWNNDLSGYFQIDSSDHRSLFSSVILTKQMNGYNIGLNTAWQTKFTGFNPNAKTYDLYVESNSFRWGKMPLSHSFGISNSGSIVNTNEGRKSETGTALRWRTGLDTLKATKHISFDADVTVSRLFGSKDPGDIDMSGSVSSNIRFTDAVTMAVVYDYAKNALHSDVLSKHRLSTLINYDVGSLTLSGTGSISLDQRFSNIIADGSYRIGKRTRCSVSYSFQDYEDSRFDDVFVMLGYKIGFREFAIGWSTQTKRFSFDLLSSF